MQPQVMCSGLLCLDMLLESCQLPKSLESVTPFQSIKYNPGGSAPQTALALTSLNIKPYISGLVADDPHGRTLLLQLEQAGVDTSSLTILPHNTIQTNPHALTALAVLPVFTDGRRGCFINLGTNQIATTNHLTPSVQLVNHLQLFHFGYPHLMPNMRGHPLKQLFQQLKQINENLLITLDLNGADVSEQQESVITTALPFVTAVHANLEEACIITALADPKHTHDMHPQNVYDICNWFTQLGAAMVFITCGKDGVFVQTAKQKQQVLPAPIQSGLQIYRPAYSVTSQQKINATGAGDAFMAGVIAQLVNITKSTSIYQIADAALASSLFRIDPNLGYGQSIHLQNLLQLVRHKSRLQPRNSFITCYKQAIIQIQDEEQD